MTTAVKPARRSARKPKDLPPPRPSRSQPAVARSANSWEISAHGFEVSMPANLTTLDRFRAWVHSDEYPERGRFSFLNGAIAIDMSPESLLHHNLVKSEIVTGVRLWLRSHPVGRCFGDGAAFSNESANVSTVPDAVFCSFDWFRTSRVKQVESKKGSGNEVELIGSPNLVVEVVSPSSVRKDTQRLPPLYFKAGVAEYWLVDARGDSLEFTSFRRGKRSWQAVEPAADGFVRSEVLGGSFRLNRGTDELGDPCYTMHSR